MVNNITVNRQQHCAPSSTALPSIVNSDTFNYQTIISDHRQYYFQLSTTIRLIVKNNTLNRQQYYLQSSAILRSIVNNFSFSCQQHVQTSATLSPVVNNIFSTVNNNIPDQQQNGV